MKIRITGRGIYGKDGKQVKPGTVIDLKNNEPPKGWNGKYVVDTPEPKAEATATTNDGDKKDDQKQSGNAPAPGAKK